MPNEVFDLAVIGAGIVGAATAHNYALRFPGARVAVLEKEHAPALHQTGRNSGVIHAGVYYKPGSLKARLCREGYSRMIEFCERHNIDHALSGKLIVAVNEAELPKLDELRLRAEANGISSVRVLEQPQIAEVEPNAGGLRALHVPDTGVTDYGHVTRQMLSTITDYGGVVRYDFAVDRIHDEPGSVVVDARSGASVRAKQVIVCAGLQSDRLSKQYNDDDELAILPFRGAYYELRDNAAAKVKSMIYPVPDPRFPFLGVHLTRHIDGSVSCGPNATISLAREARKRLALNPRDLRDTLEFPGFWKVARKYWRQSLQEMARDASKRMFAESARMYLPDLKTSDLHEYHFGVRAQAVNKNGDILDDFRFQRRGDVLFVQNAPSPAATASLAIADYVIDQLLSGN